MSVETILVYFIVALFYVISPGPAILLAIFNGLRSSMSVVATSSLGNILGLFILSTASILGLGILLKTSAFLFSVVKFVGALYLLYLGFKYIFNSKKFKLEDASGTQDMQKSKWAYFYEAFLIAITNPKAVLFFTAIFPQFLNLQSAILPQFLTMTGIFLTLSFTSLCSYGFVAQKFSYWLKHSNRMMWFQRFTGGIFIAMGAALTQLKNT